ncbi:MAG: phosphotransferase, partial [Chloroflexota bacterium]|nr:phosphotransferase [Chloroflexota bacterium]
TELWRVRRAPDADDLLLRRFEGGDGAIARREALAMGAARAHDVPVPAVLTSDTLDNRPVLLTTWCDGISAFESIAASPAVARSIGELLGEMLGRLHRVAAPDGMALPDAWITRGGPALVPLRSQLERVPNAGRLLHLDFHPRNVLMTPDTVEGVIDWTNTLTGPPHMDLARSRAILRAVVAGGALPDGMLDALHAYEAGLVEGHARVAGTDPHPELSAAWGLAMTVEDLSGHLGKPGSWVTPSLLDTLRQERDALIAEAVKERM